MEALVRWQHPELGMVSPAQFIPLAEESGQIVHIGAWVLEEACRQGKAWADAGFEPIRMAVNLSPMQFRQPDLLHVISATLQRTNLDARYLELEVTESMLMQDLQQTIATLRQLKAAGIYLSIDDFGTGYSSLSYLKGFPIDALKIDRSFVRDITQNSDDAAIATSIILLGQNLGLKVIAEGVETESQLSFLRILQCDEIQGFLFSPPVPAAEVECFLERVERHAA
jgi:EAL domain-containing protein (putative c-di-GMP-specific phosphodiesterase class I)